MLGKQVIMKTWLERVVFKVGGREGERATPQAPPRQGWNRKTGDREDRKVFKDGKC